MPRALLVKLRIVSALSIGHQFPLMKTFLFSAVLLAVVMAGNARAQIYADVETTTGDFTIQLDYTNVPKTVANFIRLAEGSCCWVDSATGLVKKAPYYKGVTFHRVILGFMNQTGSRKGDGTDGPGYKFQDEFTGGAHTGPYVVSMANSGPNTNGGQFFITMSTQTGLNNVHSVFGSVILYDAPGDGTTDTSVGRQVCSAINAVLTGSNDKPLVDVVIESITIRRVGTSAQNFNEHAQGLAVVAAPEVAVDHGGAQVDLTVNVPASSRTSYSYSSDLSTWQESDAVYRDNTDTALSEVDVSAQSSGQEKLFFKTSQVTYDPSMVLWPRLLTGKTLSISEPLLTNQLSPTWVFTFTSETGGTFVNGANSGNFTSTDIDADGLGTFKFIETSAQFIFNGQQYDVNFQTRFSKDSETISLFQGRHSGSVLLTQNRVIGASGSTKGAMTLTR